MSLRWDDIDNRHERSRKEAKELKEYLIAQQEEKKRQRLQEKEKERNSYKTIILGQNGTTQIQNQIEAKASGKFNLDNQKLNQKKDLKSIPDKLQNNSYLEPRLANDFLSKLRKSEDDSYYEDRIREHATSQPNSQYLIGNLSLRLDRLQDQSKNESIKLFTTMQTAEQREKESKEAINKLSSRFDSETTMLKQMILDFTKMEKKQKYELAEKTQHMQVLNAKIDDLQFKFDQMRQNQDQVGQNLVIASRDFTLETNRNQDMVITKHESQIHNLENAIDANSQNFVKQIQQAAQTLFLKIENESKNRKLLEEGIRNDTLEFKRIMERQIQQRMDSLHQYTQQKADADKKEFEGIVNNLEYKLQKLKTQSDDGHEQFELIINQKLELIESKIYESEKLSQKMEDRIQKAVEEYLKVVENLIVKKDVENDSRFKEQGSNIFKIQKVFGESLQVSEKTINIKIKNFEQIVRAEIKTRMESDVKIQELNSKIQENHLSNQQHSEKLASIIQGLQAENDKLIEVVHDVVKKITAEQEKIVLNFENETLKLRDIQTKQKHATDTKIEDLQLQLNNEEKLRLELEETIFGLKNQVLELLTNNKENSKRMDDLECLVKKNREDQEKTSIANNIRFDSTLEALKIELIARPTFEEMETNLLDKIADGDQTKQQLEKMKEVISQLSDKFVLQDEFVDYQKKYDQTVKAINLELKLIKTEEREHESEVVEALQEQIKSIVENQNVTDDEVKSHSKHIEEIKTVHLKEISKEISKLCDTFANQIDFEEHQKEYDQALETINSDLQAIKNGKMEQESGLVEAIELQIKTLADNQKSMDEDIEKHSGEIFEIKTKDLERFSQLSIEISELSETFINQKDFLGHQKVHADTIKTVNLKVEALQNEIISQESDIVKKFQDQMNFIVENQHNIGEDIEKQMVDIADIKSKYNKKSELLNLMEIRCGNLSLYIDELKNSNSDIIQSMTEKLSYLEDKFKLEITKINETLNKEIAHSKKVVDMLESNGEEERIKFEDYLKERNEKILETFKEDILIQKLVLDKFDKKLSDMNQTFETKFDINKQQLKKYYQNLDLFESNLKELQKNTGKIDEFRDMLKNFENERIQNKDLMFDLKNSIRNLEGLTALKDTTMLQEYNAKLKKIEKQFQNQIKDTNECSNQDIARLTEEIRNEIETQSNFTKGMNLKLKQIFSQIEKNDRDIRTMKSEMQTQNLVSSTLNSKIRQDQENSNDKLEDIVEPLNFKLDRLVMKINDLEDSMHYEKHKKEVKAETSSFYKPKFDFGKERGAKEDTPVIQRKTRTISREPSKTNFFNDAEIRHEFSSSNSVNNTEAEWKQSAHNISSNQIPVEIAPRAITATSQKSFDIDANEDFSKVGQDDYLESRPKRISITNIMDEELKNIISPGDKSTTPKKPELMEF